ncbi:MAG: glycosyltransferase family 4 protein [Burkholderiales bacterium]
MSEAVRVLLELRPALDGYAGIPQETRLMFRGLQMMEGVVGDGLIQSSGHVLAKGLAPDSGASSLPTHKQLDRLSKVVISLQQQIGSPFWAAYRMACAHLLGSSQKLTRFDPTHFEDFVWRALFARTLPYQDFSLVTKANFRIAQVPWTAMHRCALVTKHVGFPLYPRLDTSDYDIMIAETPYPAVVSKSTKLVVRYHDAIPILMPHTISDKRYHQASHYHALRCNVQNGALFSCVSDASRRDLLSIFPEVESRSVTIPNMISPHYFAEDSSPARIPEILRTRRHLGVRKNEHSLALLPTSNAVASGSWGASTTPESPADNANPLQYLLIVSTIEPRKNHATLLAAWEQLRTESHPELKLVIVGMLGWDHDAIVKRFLPWLERGELHMLEDVPAPELRLLYRHARATVCPSFGEGFDYSGVEAMCCGGAVAASDIQVHRDVYADAAEYFSPYSPREAAEAIKRVISDADGHRAALVATGRKVSAKYSPDVVLPMWREFLLRTAANK